MFLGYVRVSTQDQANGSSPEDQERVIRGMAMAQGIGAYDLSVFHDIGVSGGLSFASRTAGAEIWKAAARGDTICAAKVDRMFRDAADALNTVKELTKRGIHLVLLDLGVEPIASSVMGKAFLGMSAIFAEMERDRIRDRMLDGKKAKRARGGHAGGVAPYGFRIEGSAREARLVEVPDEQKVLRFVADLDTYTLGEVKHELDVAGLKTRTGRPFAYEQVKRLVRRAEPMRTP